MIIEEVMMKDFRSHKNTAVKFDQGTSVIIGDNGSGKTSMLEAVNFALFKQMPARLNVDDLIRRGAEKAIVSVKFHSNGRVYRVVRGRRKGKAADSALYLVKDGEETQLVRGEDEITEEIEKIIGVSGELFASAVYVKQGEIDSLISASPAVRKEHIGRLLGAHDLEKAYENMRGIIDDFERRTAELKLAPEKVEEIKGKIRKENAEILRLAHESGGTENKLKVWNEKSGKLERAIATLDKLKDLQTEIKFSEAETKSDADKLERIEKYEKDMQKTEEAHRRYEALIKEIASLQKEEAAAAGHIAQSDRLKAELKSGEDEALRFSSDIETAFRDSSAVLGTEIEDINALEAAYSKALKEAERKLESAENDLRAASSKSAALEGRSEGIQKALRELEKAGGKCPVCSAKLTEEHKKQLAADYSRENEGIKEDIAALSKRAKALNLEKIDAKNILKNVRAINIDLIKSKLKNKKKIENVNMEKINELKKYKKHILAVSNIKKLLNEKNKERTTLENYNEQYIEAKRVLRRDLPEKDSLVNRIKDKKRALEKLNREAENILKDIGRVSAVGAELSRVKEEARTAREEINRLEKDKAGIESRVNEKKGTVCSMEKELAGWKEKAAEKEKLEHFRVFLGHIRDLFHKDRLQRDLRIKSKPLIEKYTSEVFYRFNLPYSDISVTEDFNLILYGQAGEESVDMLSGGEKIASALALRIGIARALSGSAMEMLLLDEPTIHLDATRRGELIDIVKKLSAIPQTIIVTHDKEFEEAADRLISVEKAGGISTVKEYNALAPLSL